MLTNKVEQASVLQVKEIINPIFLDAREKEEYAVSFIQNTIHVGFKNFSVKKLDFIDKNAEIIVYCSVGFRSEKIAVQLQSAGYTNVRNLYGGLFEWVNQGHPVYNSDGITNKVHVFNKLWGQWLRKGEKVL